MLRIGKVQFDTYFTDNEGEVDGKQQPLELNELRNRKILGEVLLPVLSKWWHNHVGKVINFLKLGKKCQTS